MLTVLFFFFNDTATTEIYTLSLHDALPISADKGMILEAMARNYLTLPGGLDVALARLQRAKNFADTRLRSEEHTSELQSLAYLVCRLLLEKKKHNTTHRRSRCRHRTKRRQP